MNYHFCKDDKFIDDFIKDAESVSDNNIFVFLFDQTSKFVKSSKGIHAPYKSLRLEKLLKNINKKDNVFFHPYMGYKSNDLVKKIPDETKIFAMFWGYDFLQIGVDCGLPKKFTKFLYEPLTLEYLKNNVPPKKKHLLKHGLKLSINQKKFSPLIKYIQLKLDYYGFNTRKLINERHFFLNRVEAICHWNRLDIDVLENIYQIPIASKMFSYGVGLANEDEIIGKKEKKELNIFLGNSDTETNNHLDAFELLKRFKDQNIRIYCPLNYYGQEYAQMISEKGNAIFGEKFIPMLTFLQRDEYYKLMESIDICFMNHIRTQAAGNIWALINRGAKIFINEKSTIFKMYKNLGLTIYSTSEIRNVDFIDLCTEQELSISNKNKELNNNYFLKDRKLQLKSLLNG